MWLSSHAHIWTSYFKETSVVMGNCVTTLLRFVEGTQAVSPRTQPHPDSYEYHLLHFTTFLPNIIFTSFQRTFCVSYVTVRTGNFCKIYEIVWNMNLCELTCNSALRSALCYINLYVCVFEICRWGLYTEEAQTGLQLVWSLGSCRFMNLNGLKSK